MAIAAPGASAYNGDTEGTARMTIDVRMPKLSDNMEEGIIIRWMKSPGDPVAKGEPLAEVETDKADVELEATDSGILHEIKVAQGQSASVGAVIAVLTPSGEGDGDGSTAPRRADAAAARQENVAAPEADDEEDEDGDARAAAAPTRSAPSTRRAMETRRAPEQKSPARPTAPPRPAAAEPTERAVERPVRASPLAWRLAEEAGVNLDTVRGSGPGGRILRRDVESSVRGPTGAAAQRRGADAPPEGSGSSRAATTGREPAQAVEPRAPRVVQATRMRQAIATRMAEAKRDIPHFYVSAEIDMSEAMHLRESIKRREAMPGLTVTHLLLRALAMALPHHPRVNASWRDGAIELHDDVNLGIAVAVEDGLVVPVLHRAQTLTLAEIAARAGVLTEKARTGKFSGEELTGGTFSLSNVGMLDVEELVAVINPPQAAILAVGAVKDRPIARAGQLAVAKTMRATLSCDHRILNGVEGGRFLEELKDILENPVTLLLE
jgi:pyruvate dehydrogenase E2 component (dihydrolipoamide acetyltransferase)